MGRKICFATNEIFSNKLKTGKTAKHKGKYAKRNAEAREKQRKLVL